MAIIVGVASSFVSSALFLMAMNRLKPRIEISPIISRYTDENGQSVYVVKILNKGSRDVININIVFHLVKEIIVSGGEFFVQNVWSFEQTIFLVFRSLIKKTKTLIMPLE